MNYNFDEIIDRKNTNALNTDGFRDYIFKDSTKQFPFKDEEFVRMWVADMEFATPPEIIKAMQERLERKIFGYTMVFDSAYGEAFLNWTDQHYGWRFNPKTLVTSNGIIPALYELIEHICKPDEKVIIFTPSYGYFKHAADYNNIQLVTSDLIADDGGHYRINYDEFEHLAKDEKVKLCIFCNPHNPTGRVWTPEELKHFGEICLQNDLWIISDEIHCDLLRSGLTHTPLAKIFPESDRIITCMAPSKTFNMAGLMISNIVIPNDELREVWKLRHFSFENPLSVVAAQAAYTSGHEWLTQLKTYLDDNFDYTRDFLSKSLPKSVFRVSEATYLAWVNIGAYLPADVDYCLFFANNAGVLLEGGDLFVSNSDGYIRLNLACPRSVLKEGLNRIAEALNAVLDFQNS